jgi:hypothetical protein
VLYGALLQIEGEPLADGGRSHQVLVASVVPGFFEGLGHPVRTGRDLAPTPSGAGCATSRPEMRSRPPGTKS